MEVYPWSCWQVGKANRPLSSVLEVGCKESQAFHWHPFQCFQFQPPQEMHTMEMASHHRGQFCWLLCLPQAELPLYFDFSVSLWLNFPHSMTMSYGCFPLSHCGNMFPGVLKQSCSVTSGPWSSSLSNNELPLKTAPEWATLPQNPIRGGTFTMCKSSHCADS